MEDIIGELLELIVEGSAGVLGSRRIPRFVRVIIMMIYTAFLVGCIIFLTTCFIEAADIVLKIVLAILSLMLVFIIIKGWVNVFRK